MFEPISERSTRLRSLRPFVGAAAACAALALAGPARAVTFLDSTFNLSDYNSQVYSGPISPSTATSQTAGGNPGPAYQVTLSYGPNPAGYDVLATALNTGFVYDPSVSGAITTISVGLDRYAYPVRDGIPTGVGGYTLRPLIFQNGNLYEASILAFGPDGGGVWRTLTAAGLTAASFGLFDPTNLNNIDFTRNPDFTAGPITFGFAMRLGGNGGEIFQSATADLRADNLRIDVSSAVPEPSTWAMMLVGFAGLGWLGAARRRKVDIAV